MVKEENVNYYNANKYVLAFLAEHASPELLDQWKNKTNLHKFKNHMRVTKSNLPRRPMSEYIYFCREERPKIQEDMKTKNNTTVVNIHEVTCELGRRWQKFKECPDPDLKQRLRDLADIDSQRYHEEKAISSPPQDDKKHLRSKYLFFCKEQRMVDPKINMITLGQKWVEQKEDKTLSRRYEKAKKQAEKTKTFDTKIQTEQKTSSQLELDVVVEETTTTTTDPDQTPIIQKNKKKAKTVAVKHELSQKCVVDNQQNEIEGNEIAIKSINVEV